MEDEDINIIKMQSRNSQNCRSCSKVISLNEKITFLCSKCKNYFCEECANFLNEKSINKCPGDGSDPLG